MKVARAAGRAAAGAPTTWARRVAAAPSLAASALRAGGARALHASPATADDKGAKAAQQPPANDGSVFARMQREIDQAVAADAEATATAAQGPSSQQRASPDASDSGRAGAHADGASAAEGGAAAAEPPKRRGALARLWEDTKDVLAVTFGLERARDLAAEYASGERPYPWVTYVEPGTDKRLYLNTESGVVTELQPPDWARFATAAHELGTNTEASEVATVKAQASQWERTLAAVTATPLVAALLDAAATAGEAVAASPMGVKAKELRARVSDKIEDAREVWETSQHP